MTTHTTAPAVPTPRRILGASAAGVALLATMWVLGAAFEAGAAKDPWGFLAVFVTPYLLGLALLRPAPRVAAVLVGLVHLVFAIVAILAIARDPFDMWGWAAYLLVYIGAPLAAAGLVAAIRVLLGRH